MKKVALKKIIKQAFEDRKGITVEVQSEDCAYPETITNPAENVSTKATYYEQAYDENMRLKNNKSIQIISIKII